MLRKGEVRNHLCLPNGSRKEPLRRIQMRLPGFARQIQYRSRAFLLFKVRVNRLILFLSICQGSFLSAIMFESPGPCLKIICVIIIGVITADSV